MLITVRPILLKTSASLEIDLGTREKQERPIQQYQKPTTQPKGDGVLPDNWDEMIGTTGGIKHLGGK